MKHDTDSEISGEFGCLVAPQPISAYRTSSQTLSSVGMRTERRAGILVLHETELWKSLIWSC